MITINGTTIKTPQDCTIGIYDIASTADRNAAGDVLIDRIATKRRLDMEWGALSNTDCAAILTAVAPVFFAVTYPDPQDGIARTIVCYVKKRTAPMLKYTGTTPYWEGLSMTLEER
jgi:hypothetical protein